MPALMRTIKNKPVLQLKSTDINFRPETSPSLGRNNTNTNSYGLGEHEILFREATWDDEDFKDDELNIDDGKKLDCKTGEAHVGTNVPVKGHRQNGVKSAPPKIRQIVYLNEHGKICVSQRTRPKTASSSESQEDGPSRLKLPKAWGSNYSVVSTLKSEVPSAISSREVHFSGTEGYSSEKIDGNGLIGKTVEVVSVTDYVKARLKDSRRGRRKRQKEFGTFSEAHLERPRKPTTNICKQLTPVTSTKFRKFSTIVKSTVRLLGAIIDISDEKTLRSATEDQWHTLNTDQDSEGPVFHKSTFSKAKAITRLPYWAVEFLGKETGDRCEIELRKLHALLRGLKSFDKFTEQIQLSMCRAFRYERVGPRRIVLRQGHVGQNFYFIFSGSVFVNVFDTDTHGETFVKTEVVLKRGDAFGELALLQNIRRTATICCREPCEFLVVDKETFARVCPRIFEKELEEKTDFLSRLDLFPSKWWSREALGRLCSEAHIQEYKTNKVIVSDSTIDEWIYICMGGKCQVIQRMNLREEIIRKQKQLQQKTGQQLTLSAELLEALREDENREDQFDEDRSTISTVNLEQGRERLLDSMGLEYVRKKRIIPRRARLAGKEEEKEKLRERRNRLPPATLTSLIAQDREHGKDRGIVYINIKSMNAMDVFDLYSVVSAEDRSSKKHYVLVSTGARMLRVKRRSFFKGASLDAVNHAKTLAEKERYPTDDVLLNSFKDHLSWDQYKSELLSQVLKPYLQHPSRISNLARNRIRSGKKAMEGRSLFNALSKTIMQISDIDTQVEAWKRMELLSKTFEPKTTNKRQKQERNIEPYSMLSHVPEVPEEAVMRRSSVATGHLCRPYSPQVLLFEKRRYSQPVSPRDLECTTIYETEEVLPLEHSSTS